MSRAKATSAAIAVDELCRVCHVNEEAERLTGLRADDVLGRLFCRAVWPMGCGGDPDMPDCPWWRAIQGRERRIKPREMVVPMSGRSVRILLVISGVDTGTRRGALINFFDIPTAQSLGLLPANKSGSPPG
jgi:PAS domain S-box-containing protein